jgi:hypothetical protein
MQDRYQSHRLTKQGLVLQGKHSSMLLSFAELSTVLQSLSQDLPTEPRRSHEAVAVGWSGSRQRNWLDFVKQEQPHAEL